MAGRQIDPIKAERARKRLRTRKRRRDLAVDKLNQVVDELYSEVLRASVEGVTYLQIADDLGVSTVRVFKILREQRELRAQPRRRQSA